MKKYKIIIMLGFSISVISFALFTITNNLEFSKIAILGIYMGIALIFLSDAF